MSIVRASPTRRVAILRVGRAVAKQRHALHRGARALDCTRIVRRAVACSKRARLLNVRLDLLVHGARFLAELVVEGVEKLVLLLAVGSLRRGCSRRARAINVGHDGFQSAAHVVIAWHVVFECSGALGEGQEKNVDSCKGRDAVCVQSAIQTLCTTDPSRPQRRRVFQVQGR